MEKNPKKPLLTAKTLTKSNVWKLSENDVLTILENASKEIDIDTQLNRIVSIIKLAFDVEPVVNDSQTQKVSLAKRGFQIIKANVSPTYVVNWGIKKHPISRVTDLSYQNISHISAEKVLDLINSNFGGGWESLSQSIKDVILSGFHISSTTIPKSRRIEDSALYKKKVADGFSVLAVEKGSWVELIFAKLKDVVEDEEDEDDLFERRRRRRVPILPTEELEDDENDDDEGDDEDADDLNDEEEEEDDDDYNEDELTEESYRTVVDEEPDDIDVNSIDEEDEEY